MSNELVELLGQFETRAAAARKAIATPGMADAMCEREIAIQERYANDVGELVAVVREYFGKATGALDLLRHVSMNPKPVDHDHDRGTGRTTRLLLRGLIALSEQHKVMIVSCTHDHAKTLAKQLRALAVEWNIPIEFAGGGWPVSYSSLEGSERVGFRGVVLVDHSVTDGDE